MSENRHGSDQQAETRRGVVRWLVRETMGVAMAGVLLFVAAGRLDWPMAWVLVGIYAVWVGTLAVVLIPRCPELLAERVTRKKGDQAWDTVILGGIGVLTLLKYVVAGLDVRLGWTAQIGPVPLALEVAAAIVAALGYALLTWAMISNAFFSTVYRIQDDRDHTVAAGGPYRIVRHPGYAGSIAFELASPIMLGSLWTLALGLGIVALTVARTALEDRDLQARLAGYQDYARRVRYRLLPGVW